MLFNSLEFIFVYLPVTAVCFFLIARWHSGLAALWLALASLFFYGWWNPRMVVLLLGSIVFNYAAGWLIATNSPGRGKVILAVAITSNLLLLGLFKYANFFIGTANNFGAGLGLLDIILPLGISFFTFTQIAFLADAYKGRAKEFNFVYYLLFVTWFPHLIAGPVLHHQQMMPQFSRWQIYRPSAESISLGLTIFVIGLFKKIMLADQFALFANPVFNCPDWGAEPTLATAWVGALSYSLQLYFDFSGYSDMAIGLSRIFNIKLPLNFDSPYKAPNIIEFWRRWHMTLSKFLRDYLYIPLGGNRKGPVRRHINILATMLLGGLWHGSGWNFVIWGGLHGAFLVANHGWRWLTGGDGTPRNKFTRAWAGLLTFIVVVFAWVPFRATSWHNTSVIWHGMVGTYGIALQPRAWPRLTGVSEVLVDAAARISGLGAPILEVLLWLPLGLVIIWFLPNTQEWLSRWSPAWDDIHPRSYRFAWRQNCLMGAAMGLVFACCVLFFTRNSPFLYFQF